MNLRMFSKIVRPCSMAITIVGKASSFRTMSAASRATSVPRLPMAMPTSAFFSAGASFTPSPVIATTAPASCQRRIRSSFCSGETRAKT
jgi:hypothetical protein